MPQVFLSYARMDSREAKRVYRDLRRATSHEIWFDQRSLLPGIRWDPAIRNAIRQSRYFIALLSASSVSQKGYRHSELRLALEVLAEYPSDQIYLIPARLDDCPMPDAALEALNRVDLFLSWSKGIQSVVRAIGGERIQQTSATKMATTPAQFRVALVALGVPRPTLEKVAGGLNAVQTFFVFTVPPAASYRNATRRATTTIDGRQQFLVDNISQAFFEQSRYLAVDLIACFTDKPIAFSEGRKFYSNHFSLSTGPQGRFLFLSSDLLADMTALIGQSLADGLAFLLVGILVDFFTDTGYHEVTRNCPLDYCGNRTDIAYGLNTRRLCTFCSKSITTPGLRAAVNAMLAWRAV